MKSKEEILSNYNDWATFLDDRFGSRLIQFLTEEEMATIGYTLKDEYKGKHEPIEWTRENILAHPLPLSPQSCRRLEPPPSWKSGPGTYG